MSHSVQGGGGRFTSQAWYYFALLEVTLSIAALSYRTPPPTETFHDIGSAQVHGETPTKNHILHAKKGIEMRGFLLHFTELKKPSRHFYGRVKDKILSRLILNTKPKFFPPIKWSNSQL